MRENIPGFSIVDEPNMLEKLMGIASTCYPHEGYMTSFFIVMKKLAVRHPEMLEHANLIYQVTDAVMHAHRSMMEMWENKAGLPVHNRMRSTFIEPNKHILSGTFRDWSELAWFMYGSNGNNVLSASVFYTLNLDMGQILDHILENHLWPPLSDMEPVNPKLFGAKHCLKHERVTVKFRVAHNVAHALLKIREAAIDEVFIPDKMMEPIFLPESGKELKLDDWGEICVLWNGFVSQFASDFTRLRELKKEIDGEVYGDNTFNILSSEAAMLPGGTAEDLFMTMNLDHWKKTLTELTKDGTPYPIKEIMCPVKEEFQERYPFLFDKEA